MEVSKPFIDGLLVLKPKVYVDDRGYFLETYNIDIIQGLGIIYQFRQDNESLSSKGVLRGLHFQKPPYAQGKLVRVISGRVLDVVVDLRKSSPTYGQHYSLELNAENKWMFWIPPGFAHGFMALENNTIFSYKCTHVYNKEAEECLLWNDPELNIQWGMEDPLVSEKDKLGVLLKDLKTPFK
jgi:dTDP-4-dehydrorhamnose 3,5-epimerase